jgi:hypothetical protein
VSTDLEQGVRILDNALWRIVHERGDCLYVDEDEKTRPKPCDCARCIAVAALEAAKGGWRFHGSHRDRLVQGGWPREEKIHAAWVKYATSRRDPDVILAQILGEDDQAPSARDWYVATSVIQWLATNVGMHILEAAGFKYAQYEQDVANARLSGAKP